ncbi:hypothetical protein L207DRAFT_514317 [Hyaloscypha variabilis F]|uniref:Uncharacterized protein n=1 Tax=Hyaloscypha variabilis (strain UAMH 11265 / GT02V1 / F) TaxID=1149755 RepID=A0A2J6RIQ9_HYAVF|nr:hypothetical protein L207DRAFT_514317 [Hyaloscypha variabilis F]
MVTWKEVLDACDATYGKLDAAILKAKGKETEKGKSKKKSSTWGKLKWALGGEAVMKELEASLEKSSQQVMMMQQVIQLTAIKLIGKSGQVPQQAEIDEKKELMSKMDWILTGLMKSGLISHNQELGSPAFTEGRSQKVGTTAPNSIRGSLQNLHT